MTQQDVPRRNPSAVNPTPRHTGRRRHAWIAVMGVLAVVSGAVVSSPVNAQGSAASEDEVRIVARGLESGRVEFGLQQRQADDSWSDRQLPRVRFFPTTATVGRWLASSSLALPAGEVRIVARKLQSGRIEFGLQQRQPDDSWGDRQLPRVRFFPTTATVGRWLASSSLTVTPALEPLWVSLDSPAQGVVTGEFRCVHHVRARGPRASLRATFAWPMGVPSVCPVRGASTRLRSSPPLTAP